jgi:outer membrane protein TolC
MLRYLICLIILCIAAFAPAMLSADDTPPPLPSRWTAREAVRYALTHNPDVGVTMERMRAADAELNLAKAALYPQLGLSAEYNRTNNPMYSFGNILNQGMFNDTIDFNNPGTTDTLQGKATVQYRLYNGGHDQAAIEVAAERGKLSRHDHEAVRNRLESEVVRAFCTITQSEEVLRTRQSAVAAMNASLAVARARCEQGSLLREEVLNLEVQQAKAQERLVQAQHGLDLARRAFLHLLGLSGSAVVLETTPRPEQEIPAERQVRNRPELAGMAALIKAQEAHIRQAKAGSLPTADAFGSYQADKGTELNAGSGNSWAAGIRLQYTLYNGQQTEAAVARAEAQWRMVKEQQRKMEMDCNMQMERAVLALHQEEERLKVTGTMVTAATESTRLARLRFKEGVLLASELIDAENRLTDALLSHSQATAARKVAVADLRWALGLRQFDQEN